MDLFIDVIFSTLLCCVHDKYTIEVLFQIGFLKKSLRVTTRGAHLKKERRSEVETRQEIFADAHFSSK